MFRKIQEARENEEGFTLIELLVVVIIIGILAAIAIPAFLSVRSNAGDATAQSDLRNAVIHMESYYTANDAYPTSLSDITAATVGYEVSDSTTDGAALSPTSGTIGFATAPTTDDYCLTASHEETSNIWVVHDGANEPYAAAAACSGATDAPAAS